MQSVLRNLNISYLILLEYVSHLFLVVVMSFESVGGIIKSITGKLENLAAAWMLIEELC